MPRRRKAKRRDSEREYTGRREIWSKYSHRKQQREGECKMFQTCAVRSSGEMRVTGR